MLYFSNACDAQSTASCCISSDMSAFLITALRSAMIDVTRIRSFRTMGKEGFKRQRARCQKQNCSLPTRVEDEWSSHDPGSPGSRVSRRCFAAFRGFSVVAFFNKTISIVVEVAAGLFIKKWKKLRRICWMKMVTTGTIWIDCGRSAARDL
jgi:hypothetical protein